MKQDLTIIAGMARKKPDYKPLARILLDEIMEWKKDGCPDLDHPDSQGSNNLDSEGL